MRKLSLDLTNGIEHFAYPSVVMATASGVPEFSVGDIAATLFEDNDREQTLGLAVLGHVTSARTIGNRLILK